MPIWLLEEGPNLALERAEWWPSSRVHLWIIIPLSPHQMCRLHVLKSQSSSYYPAMKRLIKSVNHTQHLPTSYQMYERFEALSVFLIYVYEQREEEGKRWGGFGMKIFGVSCPTWPKPSGLHFAFQFIQGFRCVVHYLFLKRLPWCVWRKSSREKLFFPVNQDNSPLILRYMPFSAPQKLRLSS